MKFPVAKRQGGNLDTPLQIANWCAEDIYPALLTQGGGGPSTNGFHLSPGGNQTVNVTSDWQGRVWGRTNCTFDSSGHATGAACSTGDCGGYYGQYSMGPDIMQTLALADVGGYDGLVCKMPR